MRNKKEPRWKLDSQWAVDTDDYNWVLYIRGVRKDGTPGDWTPKSYYPTAAILLEDLYQKLSRTEQTKLALIPHLEYLSKRVQAMAARLYDQLSAEVWSGLHRPSAAHRRKTA
jgi:hypothetical protein